MQECQLSSPLPGGHVRIDWRGAVVDYTWWSSLCRMKGSHRRRYLVVKSVLNGVVGCRLCSMVLKRRHDEEEIRAHAVLGIGNSGST